MKISGFQNYKIVKKVLASMLAVTITVGITPSFSFATSLENESVVKMSVMNTQGPEVLWKYKNSEENCIYVGLRDDVALDKILDKNSRERVVFKTGTKEVVARYELENEELENVDAVEFIVQDSEENRITVKMSEVSLDVLRAYKNENGDIIALNLKDETNGISKVTYLDGKEIEEVHVNVDNGKHSMKSYRIDEGTTAVKVYQNDNETYAMVMLNLDWQAPEVVRLYKNEAGTKMIIKAMDNDSGIEKILLDGKNMTIEAYSNEVFEQLQQGVTKVELYDAVGHVTVVDVETDSTKPMTRIETVKDENGEDIAGKYKLTLKAPKSGLWKIIQEEEGKEDKQIAKYDEVTEDVKEMFPLDEKVFDLEEIAGIVKFKVYDAVGNVSVVDVRNVKCVIVYAHNNKEGNKIAVSLYDEREITKLAILNDAKKENVIEQFKEGTKVVRRWYETPKGTTGIKVYYAAENEQPAEFVLDRYEETPIVIGNKVYSLVGISKIKYDDGKIVEFKENMPTRVEVNLTNYDSAVIYDSLNNEVTVTK